MGSIVLLDLMGGVALLLWGLHMVRSGIMRAFGSNLRRVLGTALPAGIVAANLIAAFPARAAAATKPALVLREE